MKHLLLRGIAPSFAFLGICLSASGQGTISGSLSGTLSAGVYLANGNLLVPAGQTLTLDPGVIIKFVGARTVTVAGTLIANGTAANPVIFTDDEDDSAGGDTNNNGPSTGSPASWYGIRFDATAGASSLAWTELRFGGTGFWPAADVVSCAPSFADCTFRDFFQHGMRLNAAARPSVTDCTFTANGGTAVLGVAIDAVPGFVDNSAAGNGQNTLDVATGTLAGSAVAIASHSMLSGAVVIDANLVVPAGSSLTLDAGVILKFRSAHTVAIDGTLASNGTMSDPVILTALADDSAGGDTNGDGASTGSPASWYGIRFDTTAGASSLAWTELRFGGTGFWPAADVVSCAPSFADCTFRDFYQHGMRLNAAARPSVNGCTFTANGGTAVLGVAIDAVPGFADNTAVGNGQNTLDVATGTLAGGAVTIAPSSMLSGAVVIADNLVVPASSSLTLDAGVIFKFRSQHTVTINGTLTSDGTVSDPVILTALADDSAGGDTNGDGASSGTSAAWYGVRFASTAGASALAWTELRYCGTGFWPAAEVLGSAPAFDHCTFRDGRDRGLRFDASARPTVSNCVFTANTSVAIEGGSIQAVPGFSYNTASGNGGDYFRVTSANVTAPLTIGPQSMLTGAIVLQANLVVDPAGALEVLQGVNFKLEGTRTVTFNGPTHLRGTAYEPIVFTTLADDSVGGDTNSDGPSTGASAAWYGIVFPSTAPAGLVENVVVRYPGTGFWPGLECNSAAIAMRSVRVDEAHDSGFELSAVAPNPTNLVAWSCGGRGLHLTGGGFDVLHATTADNGTGIRAEGAWSGYLINSISRDNTNYSNLTAGHVLNSNGGFPGQNGNLFVDPQFVDAANGDLHLLATSPCLGVADYTTALLVQKDFDERPRVLDHALAGLATPDMGAYEFGNWHMEVYGETRPGETVFLVAQGPAGDSFLGFGLLGPATMIQPYGQLLAGTLGSVALVFPFTVPVGAPIPLAVPNDPVIVGTIIGLQMLNLQAGNWAHGNFSELFRVLVRP